MRRIIIAAVALTFAGSSAAYGQDWTFLENPDPMGEGSNPNVVSPAATDSDVEFRFVVACKTMQPAIWTHAMMVGDRVTGADYRRATWRMKIGDEAPFTVDYIVFTDYEIAVVDYYEADFDILEKIAMYDTMIAEIEVQGHGMFYPRFDIRGAEQAFLWCLEAS